MTLKFVYGDADTVVLPNSNTEITRIYNRFYTDEDEGAFVFQAYGQFGQSRDLTDPNNNWEIYLNGGNDLFIVGSEGPNVQIDRNPEGFFYPSFEIYGGIGSDTIGGSMFNDTIDGGKGQDKLVEFFGDDTYIVDNVGDEINTLQGQEGGTDLVKSSVDYSIPDFIENLTLTGSLDISGSGNAQSNVLRGNVGDNILDGQLGADSMSGGRGNDVYVVDSSFDQVTELSGQGIDIVESSVSYTLASFVEQGFLNSAGRSQSLTGNGLSNLLVGNSGNNTLSGQNGADELSGGLGRDVLFGGDGFDTLDGNAGADRMVGGDGNDLYHVDSGLDDVIETDGAGSGFDTVFTSVAIEIPDFVEKLVFNGESDGEVLSGNALRNFITGNYTDDIIEAGGGNDELAGGSGNDTLDGGNGGDSLSGGFGSDWIEGGSGRDILRGGAGEDRFVFVAVTDSNGTTVDRIADFEDGIDRIDLRSVDAAPVSGNQAFTFIGEDADFDGAGEVRYRYSSAQNLTFVEISVDSDDAVEMTILLQGRHNLGQGSFIL